MSEFAYSTEGFERSVYRIDGVETVVYEIGDGPPCVYFHGGGTYHGFEWARDFADSFRMILPIHPNFGESADADFTGVGDYVMHYEMLFAALGLETFHLMGASMGGHFAARYAGEHWDEIDRLVLVSPAGLKSDQASIPDFSQIPPEELPGWFVESRDWLEPYWPSQPGPEWLALRQREGAAAFRMRDEVAVSDAMLRETLKGFDRPVLLLWGGEDRIVPPGFIPEWQGLLPDAQVTVIPGGAHLLLDENAAARKAAKDFLLD